MLTRLLTLQLAVMALFVSLPLPEARADQDFCKMISGVPGPDDLHGVNLPREQKCILIFWMAYDAKPVTEMFDAAGLATYRNAIQRGECEAARALLRQQFAKSHPSAPSIMEETNVYKRWSEGGVAEHYGDLAICFGRADLRKLQAKIEEQGISALPYRGVNETMKPEVIPTHPEPLLNRHLIVLLYESAFELSGKLSRALVLLELSREGKAVKYHLHWEAYIAYRLKIAGRDDPIIGEVLARDLDDGARTRIEAAARSGNTKAIEAIPKYASP